MSDPFRPMRGALAIATNAGRNAVDASASGAQVRCRKWGQAQGRALRKRHKGRAGDRRNKTIVVNLRGLCTRSREDHWRCWLADGQVVWSWRPFGALSLRMGVIP